MKVNVATMSFILVVSMYFLLNYATANQTKPNGCDIECQTKYKIQILSKNSKIRKSCEKKYGEKKYFECKEGCNSTIFSEKRFECIRECRENGDLSDESCREKCNSDPQTREDYINYECLENCNQDLKRRIEEYYKCIQAKKTAEECSKKSTHIPTIISKDTDCFKGDMYRCYVDTIDPYYDCIQDRYSLNSDVDACYRNADVLSANRANIDNRCETMEDDSVEKNECMFDTLNYRHLTNYECEEMHYKSNLDKYEKCNKTCTM